MNGEIGIGLGRVPWARKPPTLLFLLAALASAFVGLSPLLGIPCAVCTGGLLSRVLPWMGMTAYAGLAYLSRAHPRSPFLSWAPSLYLFVHASLITEMVEDHAICLGCVAVAAIAGLAAIRQFLISSPGWSLPPFILALGVAAGFFGPFEHADDVLTRLFWPARVLDAAPAWVSREELAHCEHPAPVRVLIFEKDCKS